MGGVSDLRKTDNRISAAPLALKQGQIGIVQQTGQGLGIIGIGGHAAAHRYPDSEITEGQKTVLRNGKAELIVGKNRNGPTHTAKLVFHGETKTFKSLARGYEEMGDFADDVQRAPGYWQGDYEEEKD